jgi:murein DD-endopeptidase MepM/ murein hydrolase activator NlpD
MKRCLAALLLLFGATTAARSQTPELSLPIACTLGESCFIQQYVDVDPGPGLKDFRCGTATYEGHKGVDFRVLSVKAAEAGVPVLASAPGRVKALRDDMEDRLVRSDQDRKAVAGRECGNGVVIDHGGGWETQYCHMRRGSVAVRQGDQVAAGAKLGLVGFSGDAAFAHVHLSVRHNGGIVDPFLGVDPVSGTCQIGAQPAAGLWSPSLAKGLAYQDAAIIQTGFADRRVEPVDLEQGAVGEPRADSAALVFFARVINLRPQDRLRFSVEGPGDFKVASESEPMDRAKAQYVGVAGKKLTARSWPLGVYQGSVQVIRAGAVLREAKAAFRLQ